MSSAHDADVVRAITEAIRRYVIAHPEAADTLEGIHRWWLPPALHDEPRGRVEQVVAQLVAVGILREVAREGGRVIYASTPSRS
jgi:hypothetical protein